MSAQQWYGTLGAIRLSMVSKWIERPDLHPGARAAPEGHVGALLEAACKTGALRPVDEKTSDGYHTIGELYRHRMLLNAGLFGLMVTFDEHVQRGHRFGAHKSLLHHDGEVPFGGGWFIVVAQLPAGQISYHYQLEHWDLFDIPEQPAADQWDGHTSEQAADRLQEWLES